MREEVTEPWADEANVLDLSDTDLEASRSSTSGVSDPDRELHRLIGTYVHCEGVAVSVTIDRALRVQLARLLDNHEVPFTRETFDVAYSIPPKGWLRRNGFPKRELLELSELPREVNPEDPALTYSTSPVVREMVERAIENTGTETISEFVMQGARVLIQGD
jgi:hypothetical protein